MSGMKRMVVDLDTGNLQEERSYSGKTFSLVAFVDCPERVPLGIDPKEWDKRKEEANKKD